MGGHDCVQVQGSTAGPSWRRIVRTSSVGRKGEYFTHSSRVLEGEVLLGDSLTYRDYFAFTCVTFDENGEPLYSMDYLWDEGGES